jgi:peptidoglycan/xylan/chitin deacetylase (PgdA/CDA1 family)
MLDRTEEDKVKLVRHILKQSLSCVLYYTGLIAIWVYFKQLAYGNGSCIILAYHCFLETDDPLRRYIQDGLCVTPGNFERQLLFFQQHYRLIPLDELVDCLAADKVLPRRSLVITVDDGWRDNFTNGFPVLRKHRAPATIFLATDYVDSNREFWFLTAGRILNDAVLSSRELADVLSEVAGSSREIVLNQIRTSDNGVNTDLIMEQLKKLDYEKQAMALDRLKSLSGVSGTPPESERCTLNWEEIRLMSAGGINFGSHGQSHRIITLLGTNEVVRELTESRSRLNDQTGKKIRHYSYPNGSFDAMTTQLVKTAGYESGLATATGFRPGRRPMDRYALRRIGMHDGISSGISGRFSKAMLAFHLARFG